MVAENSRPSRRLVPCLHHAPSHPSPSQEHVDSRGALYPVDTDGVEVGGLGVEEATEGLGE